MPGLTPKQERFVLAYLETGNASAAYRTSYNAGKMKPESVNRKAFDLVQGVKIAARLDELRDAAAQKAVVTLAGHLQRLQALSEGAEQVGQFSAAVKAEESRGKASGLYTEKVEVAGAGGGPVQVVGMTVDEFARIAAEVAART